MCSTDTTGDPGNGLSLADKITAGASGSRTSVAAAIILTETINGRLLAGIPLAWEDDQAAEIDWETARTELGALSGGERRLFGLADSLATGEPVDLNDTLTGLDSTNGRVVLEAVAYAMGFNRPNNMGGRR